MKKHFTLFSALVFVLTFQLVSSQIQVENPQITPVSPEAASFGRYGNVALNSASGQMSYTVPLYNIVVDGNSWPVTLNYNYGGLILEGKPSLSGLGWNLSSYGSITKEVRGLPDGHPDGYYGVNDRKTMVDNIAADYQDDQILNQTTFLNLTKFRDGIYDSEVDKYNVNIGSIRFSFKLRYDNNGDVVAYYLSKHNYKVSDITKSTLHHFEIASFVVTDDSGIKYYFNSNNRETVVQEPAGTSVYFDDSVTSWMLSQIKYINGQSIDFEYDPNTYYSWDFVANGVDYDLDTSTEIPPIPYVQQWTTGYSDEVRYTEMQRQILKKITFPSGSIDLTTIPTGRKLFDSLIIKDINNTAVTTYNFSHTGNRNVLVNITKNSEKFFDFEYYGVNTSGYIPPFFESYTEKPFDQDDWKFFNDAGNNRAIHMPNDGFQYKADKTPNFSATRQGALKRIVYPTGGYSEVEYEQNQVKKPYEEGLGSSNESFNKEIFISLEPKLNNSNRYISITHTFDNPVRAQLSHKITGNVELGNSIYVSVEKISGPPDNYGSCYSSSLSTIMYYPIVIQDARNKMINDPSVCPYYPNPILSPSLLVELDPDNGCPWYPQNGDDFSQSMGCTSDSTIDQNDSSRGDFWIAPGTYKFTIDVRNFVYEPLYAEIKLSYFDAAVANGGTLPDYMNVNVGGIRVKKLIDYDENGSYSNVKHFNYNESDGFSSGRLNQIPIYINRHTWNHHDSNATSTDWIQEQIIYLQNSYTTLNSSQGIPVYYGEITTHNTTTYNPSGAFPKGFTVQTFRLPNEDLTYEYPSIPKKEDITKAQPWATNIYDNNSILKSYKTLSYTPFRGLLQYQTNYDVSNDHPWSFKYFKKLQVYVDWDTSEYSNLNPGLNTPDDIAIKALNDIKLYKEVNEKNLVSSESTETQGVAQSKTMTYDSYQLLQSVATYDSNGNEIKVEYDYPYELPLESQYQNMLNKSQLSTAVQQRTIKGGQLTEKKTNFIQILNNGYKPWEILTSKGNENLEKQLIITYDNVGNIKQFQKDENSPTTSTIWGYGKTLPVAKIENATYSDIEALLEFGTGFSITDSLSTDQEDALRALPNTLVTTYTYDPLVGVTSITDPNGQTVTYHYDEFNRLEFVKDKDGMILSQNQYNYKN